MKRDPIGRTILQDRPLIGSSSLPLASLRSMPDGSLGCEYARFLETHRFNPDERTAVNFIDDPELAYVMLRYRQVCSASVGRCALGLTLHLAPHAAGPVATSVLVAFRVRSTISGTWCLRCHQHFSERSAAACCCCPQVAGSSADRAPDVRSNCIPQRSKHNRHGSQLV
eukprot:1077581-Pleurochrysis_carterae.AAC.1